MIDAKQFEEWARLVKARVQGPMNDQDFDRLVELTTAVTNTSSPGYVNEHIQDLTSQPPSVFWSHFNAQKADRASRPA